MVAELKLLAPNAWFGGPVNYQANPKYIAEFVRNANPKPDFVSWHTYTCASSANQASCLLAIDRWALRIDETKRSIEANGDVVPPIMITEWNYAPDGGVSRDDKHADDAFMSLWTEKALKTLMASGVYATHQFNVSSSTPLLGSTQGLTFQNICSAYAGKVVEARSLRVAAVPTTIGAVATAPPNLGPVAAQPASLVARDTFQRSDQPYWGQSSDGQSWTGEANNDAAFSVSAGKGQIKGASRPYNALLGPIVGDGEVLVSGEIDTFTNTNLGVVVRWGDGDNWYKAYLDGGSLVVQKRVEGATTLLERTEYPAATKTSYSIRFRAFGKTLAAKAWPTGDAEPADWTLIVDDPDLEFGRLGLRPQLQIGATVMIHSFEARDLARETGN